LGVSALSAMTTGSRMVPLFVILDADDQAASDDPRARPFDRLVTSKIASFSRDARRWWWSSPVVPMLGIVIINLKRR